MDCLDCDVSCVPIYDSCVVHNGSNLGSQLAKALIDLSKCLPPKDYCDPCPDQSITNIISSKSVNADSHPMMLSYGNTKTTFKNKTFSWTMTLFSDYIDLSYNGLNLQKNGYDVTYAISIVGKGLVLNAATPDGSFLIPYGKFPLSFSFSVLSNTENGVVELSKIISIPNTDIQRSSTVTLDVVDKGYVAGGYKVAQNDFNFNLLSGLNRLNALDYSSYKNVNNSLDSLDSKVSAIAVSNTYTYLDKGVYVTSTAEEFYNLQVSKLSDLTLKLEAIEALL